MRTIVSPLMDELTFANVPSFNSSGITDCSDCGPVLWQVGRHRAAGPDILCPGHEQQQEEQDEDPGGDSCELLRIARIAHEARRFGGSDRSFTGGMFCPMA